MLNDDYYRSLRVKCKILFFMPAFGFWGPEKDRSHYYYRVLLVLVGWSIFQSCLRDLGV
jgi:hypothetical protein